MGLRGWARSMLRLDLQGGGGSRAGGAPGTGARLGQRTAETRKVLRTRPTGLEDPGDTQIQGHIPIRVPDTGLASATCLVYLVPAGPSCAGRVQLGCKEHSRKSREPLRPPGDALPHPPLSSLFRGLSGLGGAPEGIPTYEPVFLGSPWSKGGF